MKSKLPIGPIIAGLVLIVLGVLFLVQEFTDISLDWDAIWPWSLIIVGLVFLLLNWKSNWWGAILVVLGIAFLLQDQIPNFSIGRLWPLALVIVGVGFVITSFTRGGRDNRSARREQQIEDRAYERGVKDAPAAASSAPRDETHDATPHTTTPVATEQRVTERPVAEPLVAERAVNEQPVSEQPVMSPYDAPGADTTSGRSHTAYASGGSRLEDPNAPGFTTGPAASSRLEDPNASGFSSGPAAGPYDDGQGSSTTDGRPRV